MAFFEGIRNFRRLMPCASLMAFPFVTAGAMPSLETVDRNFVCPEAMHSDADRMASLRAFFSAYAAAEPSATPSDMLEFRHVLLAKHGCAKTLKHLEASDEAVRAGDVEDQAWLPIQTRNGISLSMSANHVVVVLDPRSSAEKTVDAYARLTLSSPAQTDVTHVRYDGLVSHSQYFCASHRYALQENVYFLGGKRVLVDEGRIVGRAGNGKPLYAIAEIPSGSMNDDAWRWACDAARGHAA